MHKQWRHFESALAIKSPANEAEYAHDKRTRLVLYDCIVPQLRENRKLNLPLRLKEKYLFDDYEAKKEAFKYEFELEKKRLPSLEAKCKQQAD